MDPHAQFCHNSDCPARGQVGLDNIRIHRRQHRRYRCTTCDRTFAETRDTPFYRLKKPAELMTIVLTLLCHGCPLQAIVAAFGRDRPWQERTPAMAAGLTDHCWTMLEWLSQPIPMPPWVPPKRRGRPPKRFQEATA